MYLNNQEHNYYYINFYEMNCFFHLRSISQVSTLVYCNICCRSVSNNVILPIILLQPFWLWYAAHLIVVSFCRYSTLWYRGQFVSGNVIYYLVICIPTSDYIHVVLPIYLNLGQLDIRYSMISYFHNSLKMPQWESEAEEHKTDHAMDKINSQIEKQQSTRLSKANLTKQIWP